jgi:hypothetical protein
VDHLRAQETVADLAEGAHAGARRKLLQLARVEVDEAQPHDAGAVLQVTHQLAPGPVLDRGVHHLAFHQDRAPRRRGIDRIQRGFVVVAQRQVQDEIELALDSQLGELGQGGLRQP